LNYRHFDEPTPSLHHHPSEQRLRSYYESVRQRPPDRYSVPSVTASARSLSPASRLVVPAFAFSCSVQEQQARATPSLRRAPLGQ